MSMRNSVFAHRDDILALADRYGLTNVRLFGSVAILTVLRVILTS
jgi:hypothetical protein